MKVINRFDDVATLDLPIQIKTQLYHQLTLPFNDDMPLTSRFWAELGTVLILIEDDDTCTNSSDSLVGTLLTHIIEQPEFVVMLKGETSSYLLALSITNDSGCGCYLLTSINNNSYPVQLLIQHIE